MYTIRAHRPVEYLAAMLVAGTMLAGCGGQSASDEPVTAEPAPAEQPPAKLKPALPPLGEKQKIRFFFTQWWHFTKDRKQLMADLADVGATIFADWGCSAETAKLAHEHGIHYFCGYATKKMRGPAQANKTRLAVDKTGRTCLQRFEDYVKEGGDPNKPWGSFGEGKGAYVPCPLDRFPWTEAIIKPIMALAKEGLVDGLNLDFEGYAAYGFDHSGEMLCYCDDCFGKYLIKKQIDAEVERKDRHAWLEERGLLVEYLDGLRVRLIAMYKSISAEIRADRPDFTFSAYGQAFEHAAGDIRANWRGLALPEGMSSPQSPFIAVDSTPYWEDPTRNWWDGMHLAYRKLGIRHVMGSWDMGIMGDHNESHVGAAELMYELAMATDGFWRWGEREFDTDDWRSFALVNQKLRQVENRIGEFLFKGEDVKHFVTLVEQTGNPFLERALFARTWKLGGKHMVRIFNGNTDWPIHVRVRFPQVKGQGTWRLFDPMHDVEYVPARGQTWTAASLNKGVVAPMAGRSELFLQVEPAEADYQPDPQLVVPSFEIATHKARPERPKVFAKPEQSAGPGTIVYCRSASVGYKGPTAGRSYGTVPILTNVDGKSVASLFRLQGYCRQPRFSPDGKQLAAAFYVNGYGQIYLLNATGGQAINISNNDFCDRSPTFTPDGQRIVFVSDRDGNWNIYSMNLDGSDAQQLTDSPAIDRSPSVSPDGRHIAFISNRDTDFDVHVMNIDGSNQRAWFFRLGNEYEPIWSPDGQFLACTLTARNLRWMQIGDVEGENFHFVAHGVGTHIESIRFSPDGTQIAGAYRRHGEAGIFVMDAELDRTADMHAQRDHMVRKLVTTNSHHPYPDGWYATGTGTPRYTYKTFSGVNFSPDGKTLVYCSDQGDDGMFRLYTIPVTVEAPPADAEAEGESEAANDGEAEGETASEEEAAPPPPPAPLGPTSVWPMNTDWSRK